MTKEPLEESNCRGQLVSVAAGAVVIRAARAASVTMGIATPIERALQMGRGENISCLLDVPHGEDLRAKIQAALYTPGVAGAWRDVAGVWRVQPAVRIEPCPAPLAMAGRAVAPDPPPMLGCPAPEAA